MQTYSLLTLSQKYIGYGLKKMRVLFVVLMAIYAITSAGVFYLLLQQQPEFLGYWVVQGTTGFPVWGIHLPFVAVSWMFSFVLLPGSRFITWKGLVQQLVEMLWAVVAYTNAVSLLLWAYSQGANIGLYPMSSIVLYVLVTYYGIRFMRFLTDGQVIRPTQED